MVRRGLDWGGPEYGKDLIRLPAQAPQRISLGVPDIPSASLFMYRNGVDIPSIELLDTGKPDSHQSTFCPRLHLHRAPNHSSHHRRLATVSCPCPEGQIHPLEVKSLLGRERGVL